MPWFVHFVRRANVVLRCLSQFNRDRFVLSNGHACALQYIMLHLTGYDLSLDDLKAFRQLGSKYVCRVVAPCPFPCCLSLSPSPVPCPLSFITMCPLCPCQNARPP